MIDVAEALLARKSVRAYLNEPVSRVDIETILNYARYSPSGTNTQPWDVAVVTGNSKQQLDALLLKQFNDGILPNMDYHYYPEIQLPPHLQSRRRACGLQLFNALGITRDAKEKRMLQWAKNYSAFGAPVALYFFVDAVLEKGAFIDCGMFLQSIMLMASALGLATCPQAALAEQPQIVKTFLGRSQDNVVLVCGMALGYEDTSDAVNGYRTVREDVANFTKFYD